MINLNMEEQIMETFKVMWQYLWDLIYGLLEVFGIVKDENGNLTDAE